MMGWHPELYRGPEWLLTQLESRQKPDIAKECGVSYTCIGYWEGKARAPNIPKLLHDSEWLSNELKTKRVADIADDLRVSERNVYWWKKFHSL